jgi:hypothetical protein
LGISNYLPQIETDLDKYTKYRKLFNLLKVSDRIKFDDLKSILGIPREDIISFLMDMNAVTSGFKIDGDSITVAGDANLDGLLGALDKQFGDWSEKEETKEGKVEDFKALEGDFKI